MAGGKSQYRFAIGWFGWKGERWRWGAFFEGERLPKKIFLNYKPYTSAVAHSPPPPPSPTLPLPFTFYLYNNNLLQLLSPRMYLTYSLFFIFFYKKKKNNYYIHTNLKKRDLFAPEKNKSPHLSIYLFTFFYNKREDENAEFRLFFIFYFF